MNPFEITFASIIFMIFLGYALKKIDLLKSKDVEPLNKLVVNVTMPCMIFTSLYVADVALFPKLAIMPVIGILSGAITGFISYIVLIYLKVPKIKKWSLLITVTLGNTALLGFPIVLGVFGSQALIRAIFFDIASLSTFLGLSVILMANFGGELKAVLKKVLLFPVLWAVIFGIVLNVFNIPIGPVLDKSLNYIGGATIHLIMIVLGLSLDFRAMLNNFKIASAVSLVKLFLFPFIATIIIFIVGLTGTEFTIGIVEAAMPSGMLTLVLAINYGLDYKLTTDCLFLSTVFSLITLPLIIGFL